MKMRHGTIRTTKDRCDPLEPSIRDGLLAATPGLRAFAMSLSYLDRADDLVQDTLLRAISNIELFQPGTNVRLALHNPPQPVPLGIPQAHPRSRRHRR
jgi:hypothetical protein